MPRSPNRLLHGTGHPRLPSPAMVAGGGATPAQRTPTGIVQPSQPETNRNRIIPVSVINAFFQMLPSPDIQQQAIARENTFAAVDLDEGLVVGTIVTRPQQVYIWTDVFYYAVIPGPGMASPPVQLTEYQLSGLVRFDLTIDDRNPMNLTANTASPYFDPLYPTQGNLSGWQVLNQNFGSTRYGSAFALYARSQQVTTITMKAVQRGRYPRFPITKVGVQIHGYVASEGNFDEVWRRTIGGGE